MSKKCICLVRVSTEQQKLEGQKEKVISAAISDGYKLEEIAVVEGKESAIKLQEEERETLNEMKNIILNILHLLVDYRCLITDSKGD